MTLIALSKVIKAHFVSGLFQKQTHFGLVFDNFYSLGTREEVPPRNLLDIGNGMDKIFFKRKEFISSGQFE